MRFRGAPPVLPCFFRHFTPDLQPSAGGGTAGSSAEQVQCITYYVSYSQSFSFQSESLLSLCFVCEKSDKQMDCFGGDEIACSNRCCCY
jgi:hypothetical protein